MLTQYIFNDHHLTRDATTNILLSFKYECTDNTRGLPSKWTTSL